MTPRMLTLTLLLGGLLAGCGQHFWQRTGGTVQEFDRDSLVCVEEARAAKYGIGAEDLYRGCMKARGWQRVQAPIGDVAQFRGPEDAEDLALPPPSPYSGPRYDTSRAEINAAEAKVVCQRPAAMRPVKIACPAGQ